MPVLIFSETSDNTTNCVCSHLNDFGVAYLRINSNLQQDRIEFVEIGEKAELKFSYKGNKYSLKDFNLIWFRRGMFNFKPPLISNNGIDQNLLKSLNNHLIEETNDLKEYLKLFIEDSGIYVIGSATHNAINKLWVLKKANDLGIKVPYTCISENGNLIIKHKKNINEFVTKPISNIFQRYIISEDTSTHITTYQSNCETIRVEEIKNSSFYYTLFQEKIKPKFELRIFFIEDKYYAAAIYKTKKINAGRRMHPLNLPYEINRKLKTLMEHIGLNTGSIDMMVDSDLNFYFLEVNPCGQIEWLGEQCFPNIHYNIATILKKRYEKEKK